MTHRNVQGGILINTVYPNLDAELKKHGLTYPRLAEMLGISKSTIYRKIQGKSPFKLVEVAQICQILNVTVASELFMVKY